MTTFRLLIAGSLLAALGAAAGWVGHRYHHDLERARARIATGSQVIATACGPIEYAESGNGPVALVVHGAGGGFDQGREFGNAFALRGYRVIAMSRFGYLRTPAPPNPSAALQASAHACLLDALGIDAAALIAISAGAPSALEFALNYPARCTALVLLVPGWFAAPPADRKRMGPLVAMLFERSLRSDFLFWAIGRFAPATAVRTVLGTPPGVVASASRDERARVAAVLQDILPVSARQTGLVLEARLTTAPLSRALQSLRVPTLVISSEDDLYRTSANARAIARQVPGSRLVVYPTGGHLFVGHNREVTDSVTMFLREHGWTGPGAGSPRSPRPAR